MFFERFYGFFNNTFTNAPNGDVHVIATTQIYKKPSSDYCGYIGPVQLSTTMEKSPFQIPKMPRWFWWCMASILTVILCSGCFGVCFVLRRKTVIAAEDEEQHFLDTDQEAVFMSKIIKASAIEKEKMMMQRVNASEEPTLLRDDSEQTEGKQEQMEDSD